MRVTSRAGAGELMQYRFLIMVWCLGLWRCAAAEVSVSDARDVVQRWIETRRVVEETRNGWALEKDMMEASVRMFERELEDLRGRMATLGEGSAAVENERGTLEEEKALLLAAGDRVKKLASTLEQRIKLSSTRFPPPLLNRVRPLLERFPEDPAQTRLTASERMQNLVGLVNEVDRFNGAISVESEIRSNPSGLEVQVETLYLGLARGYFVGDEGRFAGVTVPTESGWEVTLQPELGPLIRRAIAMYRNQQPAALVKLPFEIQ